MIEQRFKTGNQILDQKSFDKPSRVHFKNAEKASELLNSGLRQAKDNKAMFIIHSDIDFDGLASTYLMYKTLLLTLQKMGMIDRHYILPTINSKREHCIKKNFVDLMNTAIDKGTKISTIIIVDSSTNELEYIRSLKCNVVVIDHHELEIGLDETCGRTAGGEYVIVNNEIDGIADMSGAEVVYELLRDIGYETLLEQEKLASWVGVSLFSDVIDADNERNQWYIEQIVAKKDAERNLDCMFKSVFKGTNMNKSDISFGLVPIINAAIRTGNSVELLNCVLTNPSGLEQFKQYKTMQAQRVDRAFTPFEMNLRKIDYNDFIMYDLTDAENMEGFEGLIATKLQDSEKKTAIVFRETDTGIRGSFRLGGKMLSYDFKKELADREGFTASGHREAFGFTVTADSKEAALEKLMQAMIELNSLYANSNDFTSGDIIIDVHSREEMTALRKSGEIGVMGEINARMTTTKKVLIRVLNTDDNVKVTANGSKVFNVDVLGLSAQAFKEPEANNGFIYLYPEINRMLTIYVDGVRA